MPDQRMSGAFATFEADSAEVARGQAAVAREVDRLNKSLHRELWEALVSNPVTAGLQIALLLVVLLISAYQPLVAMWEFGQVVTRELSQASESAALTKEGREYR